MSSRSTHEAMAIILAAGKGTRLNSIVPKPLHEVAGQPLLQFSLDLCHQADLGPTILVYDADFPEVMQLAGTQAKAIPQPGHLYGTGHAVQAALLAQPQHTTTTVVLYADTPLLQPETVTSLISLRAESNAAIVVLSTEVENPNGYGRILRDESSGQVRAIVESHIASEEERQICEINTGIMVFESDWLRHNIAKIRPDPQKGELLLTDTVKVALAQGKDVECLQLDTSSEGIGCDRQQDLEKAEQLLRKTKLDELMTNGVSIEDPKRTYIDLGVTIGSDTRILAGCHITGKTIIGSECRIGPNAQITDATISDHCTVKHASVLTSTEIAAGSSVGPFAHLRDGTILDREVDIGTSSEIKNSKLGAGTVMRHFGFIGDTDVGENVNIGAGVVTCNYDGTTKHRTTIGDDSFIGSGSMLVAPLAIGNNVFVGAGSVVTRNVADGNIVYGVPARVRATANKDT